MDKNIIKSHLTKRFLSEEITPGISVTDKAKKESEKINKAGVSAVEKDVKSYDKSLKQENPDNGKMAKNKYNYTDDAEKTYHDEMEILNGQEMIEYTSEPGAEFKKRAEESLEGSTRMGNKIGANAEAVWGASSDEYGKDLVKRIKDSSKKRADAEIQTAGMGDVQIPTGNKVQTATTAMGAGKPKGDTTKAMQSSSTSDKTKVVKENKYPVYLKRSLKEAPVAAKSGLVGSKATPTEKKSSGATSGNSDVRSPTSTEVRSPTSTDVRSPTSTETSTDAYTSGNITVTGGAGAGNTEVHIHVPTPEYERLPSGQGRKKHMPSAITQPGPNEPDMPSAITQSGPNEPSVDKDITENKEEYNDGEDYEKLSREVEYDVNPHSKDKVTDYKSEKKDNNNKTKIKESMKRLTWKAEFEGVNTTQKIGHALTLIPEGYRVNNKEFEMTDGNVSLKVRWEGNLNEGKAVVLNAANNTLISEDMTRMKQLMGYKSQDTLGLVKGNARLDENKAFSDIWKKTRKLLGESEDIEDADAATGDIDLAVGFAKEAKKDINGSVSTEKGTQAPKPKTGDMVSLDKVVKHAAEAKKHIEGSVATEKKTEAPAPKVGNWEEIKKAQASEAKKDIESGTATHKATDTAKVVKENFKENDSEEEEEGPEPEDNYNKPDAEDDSSMDAEPSANDIKGDVPPAIGGDDDDAMPVVPAATSGIKKMKNPDTNELFLTINGKHAIMDDNNQPVAVPQHLFDTYGKDYDEVIEAMERGEGESDELEEGMFGGNDLRNAKAQEFDQVNAKLVGTRGDQTANKEKWLARAKNDDNFKGNFIIDRGILQYKNKSAIPATGGSSGMGTANENRK